MDNNELGILVFSKLDQSNKTISQLNNDLQSLADEIGTLNLKVSIDGISKDINKQVQQINSKNKQGIKIDTDVSDVTKDFQDVNKYVENLKKQFGATSASIRKEIDVANKRTKSWLVTLQKADDVTRKIRITPTDLNSNGFQASDLTIIDDREVKKAKELDKAILDINRSREKADKAFASQVDKAEKQLEIERRMASIRVQDLRRRYEPVLTSDQNKQLDDYVAKVNKLNATTPNLQHQLRLLGTEFKQVSSNVAEAGSRTDSFISQLGVAMQRIPIWMVGMSAFYAPLRGIQSAVDQIVMLDTQMTELRRVMDSTPQTYNRLLNESIALSTELGNRVEDVNNALVEFARQGYDPSTLINLTETATVASNISSLLPEEAMSTLTASMKAFNIEAENSISIIDRLNEIDNNFAINTATLSDALERSSSTANTFGVTIDELLGHISAIGITTRESGSVIGRDIADVKPFLIDLELLTYNGEDDRAQAESLYFRAA